MTRPRRGRRLLVQAIGLRLVRRAATTSAHTGTPWPVSPEGGGLGVCSADCTEADLRAAVDYLNRSCPAGAALIFNGPSCTGSPTIIEMEQKVQGPSCNS